MTLSAWIALLAAWGVALVSPGPDLLAVLRGGAVHGRRDALLVSAGVVSGISCWIVLAVTGLSVVLAAHAEVHTALRLVGAGVLTVYGLSILWQSRRAAAQPGALDAATEAGPGPEAGSSATHGAASTPSHPRRSGFAAYRLGLLTNLGNPKALVFFGALLASLLPPQPELGTKVEVTLAMAALASAWFAAAAFMASSRVVVDAHRRASRVVDRVLGSLFVGLGGVMLTH